MPDFTYGTTNKTPEYLAKFPLGKIPAFEGADGFLLTEGNAIGCYIAESAPSAEKRAQLLGRDVHERARVQQWMWFAWLDLERAVNPLVGWRFGFGEYNATAEQQAEKDLQLWLVYLEGYLQKGHTWLADTAK